MGAFCAYSRVCIVGGEADSTGGGSAVLPRPPPATWGGRTLHSGPSSGWNPTISQSPASPPNLSQLCPSTPCPYSLWSSQQSLTEEEEEEKQLTVFPLKCNSYFGVGQLTWWGQTAEKRQRRPGAKPWPWDASPQKDLSGGSGSLWLRKNSVSEQHLLKKTHGRSAAQSQRWQRKKIKRRNHYENLWRALFFFFFFLSFLGPRLRHLEIPRLGVKSELQLLTYTTAHGNAGSLTHWARPGIEPATLCMLVKICFRWATTGTSHF